MNLNLKKVRRCSVPGCTNDSKANPQLIYFGFPKDEQRSKEWIQLIKRPDLATKDLATLNSYYKVCSEHFEAKLYQRGRLKTYAVPTIFNNPGKEKKVTPKIVKRVSFSDDLHDTRSTRTHRNGISAASTTTNTSNHGTSTLTDINGVKLPVYLHVGSNQINAKLQNKIKNLIGSSVKTDGPIVTNITAEQFQKICDMLTRENITL